MSRSRRDGSCARRVLETLHQRCSSVTVPLNSHLHITVCDRNSRGSPRVGGVGTRVGLEGGADANKVVAARDNEATTTGRDSWGEGSANISGEGLRRARLDGLSGRTKWRDAPGDWCR